jgi:hypothetical protein
MLLGTTRQSLLSSFKKHFWQKKEIASPRFHQGSQ